MNPAFKNLFILLFFSTNISYSQNSIVENNNRIASFIETFPFCKSNIVYPEKYRRLQVKRDLKIIRFIDQYVKNDLVDSGLTIPGKKIFGPSFFDNGLIKTQELALVGNYVIAKVRVEFIDKFKLREKITILTQTRGSCATYKSIMLDFNFIRRFVLNNIDAVFNMGAEEMVFDTLYINNIRTVASQYPEYKFIVPQVGYEDWVNSFLSDQYKTELSCCYGSPPPEFIKLIKEQRVELIRDLLFSSNYFVSLNAMEALIYLTSVNEVSLNENEKKRVNEIRNGAIKFEKRAAPDFVIMVDRYRDLEMTDEKIIRKYKTAL